MPSRYARWGGAKPSGAAPNTAWAMSHGFRDPVRHRQLQAATMSCLESSCSCGDIGPGAHAIDECSALPSAEPLRPSDGRRIHDEADASETDRASGAASAACGLPTLARRRHGQGSNRWPGLVGRCRPADLRQRLPRRRPPVPGASQSKRLGFGRARAKFAKIWLASIEIHRDLAGIGPIRPKDRQHRGKIGWQSHRHHTN